MAVKKTGLGKGLNALFADTLENEEEVVVQVKKEDKILEGEVVQTLKLLQYPYSL